MKHEFVSEYDQASSLYFLSLRLGIFAFCFPICKTVALYIMHNASPTGTNIRTIKSMRMPSAQATSHEGTGRPRIKPRRNTHFSVPLLRTVVPCNGWTHTSLLQTIVPYNGWTHTSLLQTIVPCNGWTHFSVYLLQTIVSCNGWTHTSLLQTIVPCNGWTHTSLLQTIVPCNGWTHISLLQTIVPCNGWKHTRNLTRFSPRRNRSAYEFKLTVAFEGLSTVSDFLCLLSI